MKRLFLALPVLVILFGPSVALASNPDPYGWPPHDTDVAYVFVSPDAVRASVTQDITFKFQNKLGFNVDAITIHQPSSSYINFTGADKTAYSSSSVNYQFGSYASKLSFPNNSTWTVTMHTTTGSWKGSDHWIISMIGWDSFGTPTTIYPTGNLTEYIGDTPTPTNPAPTTAFTGPAADSLNSSGLGDLSTVHGLLEPGPIDSLLVLPVNLLTALIASAGDPESAVGPHVTLLGHSAYLANGQSIYDGLGDDFKLIVSNLLEFFILLLWLRSLYHRLQRATSLKTHEADTWGVL